MALPITGLVFGVGHYETALIVGYAIAHLTPDGSTMMPNMHLTFVGIPANGRSHRSRSSDTDGVLLGATDCPWSCNAVLTDSVGSALPDNSSSGGDAVEAVMLFSDVTILTIPEMFLTTLPLLLSMALLSGTSLPTGRANSIDAMAFPGSLSHCAHVLGVLSSVVSADVSRNVSDLLSLSTVTLTDPLGGLNVVFMVVLSVV